MKKEFAGEVIGTFILVFIGCGAVAVAVLFNAFSSLYQIAIVWGLAVTLAIFCSRSLSAAHLNPAVTAAMVVRNYINLPKALFYITAQMIGAILAAVLLILIFENAIDQFEFENGITRGSSGSHLSAMMFGEFFPNPSYPEKELYWWQAMGIEALGTFMLVFSIFSVIERQTINDNIVPWLIGATVSVAICLFAPYTQCGINPARDFGPRLVAAFSGWGLEAFPKPIFSFFTVYILGPILGGIAASYLFGWLRKS